jgi:hypothetical protein
VTGVVRHPCGPRLYLFGQRIHHGTVGCLLLAAGAAMRRPWLAAVGATAVSHDAADFPWRETDNHGVGR